MWSVQLHVTCRDAGDATQSHGQVASLRTRVVWYWSEEARVGPVTRLCDPMADSAGVCVSFVGRGWSLYIWPWPLILCCCWIFVKLEAYDVQGPNFLPQS